MQWREMGELKRQLNGAKTPAEFERWLAKTHPEYYVVWLNKGGRLVASVRHWDYEEDTEAA